MSYEIERSSQLIRDIEEAFVYIAEGDIDKGVHFLVAVEETLEMLSANPLMGSNRRFENKKLNQLRSLQVKGFENYLIVYLAVPNDKVVKPLRLLSCEPRFRPDL